MRRIFAHRGLRLVFAANMISMLGSGLNSAAVVWYVLEQTKSEVNLAYLVMIQTIPAMLLLPFSGVFIDREDRRHLVMALDAIRGVVILTVALLAMHGQVKLWQLYVMNTLVAAGFWMFWPTVTALIQELTPESEFVHSNTFLMAGVQGGWLIAGSIVGFLYDHVGLGPILLIDVSTYVVSFLLYLGVRKGRHVVAKPREETEIAIAPAAGPVNKYFAELKEGVSYIRAHHEVIALGVSWALFLGAMLTQGIITAPLSERILHSGAVGYGWMNGAWGVGAFLSALYAAQFIRRFPGKPGVALGFAALSLGMFAAPFSRVVAIAVIFFFIMGSARGLLGITLNSTMMEIVPKHFMGRVQNAFYFGGVWLQLLLGLSVGLTAHRISLTVAYWLVAGTYGVAFVLTTFFARRVRVGQEVAV
jgi:DHA3 family macrolide efflux protein-like MFS transporter